MKQSYVDAVKELLNSLYSWRKDWIDVGDYQEAISGCDCEQCGLIRAYDNYLASKPKNR